MTGNQLADRLKDYVKENCSNMDSELSESEKEEIAGGVEDFVNDELEVADVDEEDNEATVE